MRGSAVAERRGRRVAAVVQQLRRGQAQYRQGLGAASCLRSDRGRVRGGLGLWFIGNSLIYVVARSIARLREKPRIIGSLCTFWGYVHAFLTRHERYGDDAYLRKLRRYERRALLYGKRRAIEMYNHEIIERRRNAANTEAMLG